jgi:outer membrane protein OmpA-like peptidoglycan-associated protein
MPGMPPRLRTSLRLIACCSLLATSGCAMYRLEELRHAEPKGNVFQTELSRLYMDFAEDQEKNYDWANSWHFADKGLMAAYGKDVAPENPDEWNIPEDALADMQKTRTALLAVLTPENEQRYPGESANAQFFFDCWVKYQDTSVQEDSMTYCHDNAVKYLAALQAGQARHAQPLKPPEPQIAPPPPESAAPVKPAASPKKPLAKKPAAKPKTPAIAAAPAPAIGAETASYIIFFEKGQPVPSDAGNKALADIIGSLDKTGDVDIVISDHSSAAATDPVLAKQRADVVRKLLLNAGIPAAAIEDGATAPHKAAARVEIFLNE